MKHRIFTKCSNIKFMCPLIDLFHFIRLDKKIFGHDKIQIYYQKKEALECKNKFNIGPSNLFRRPIEFVPKMLAPGSESLNRFFEYFETPTKWEAPYETSTYVKEIQCRKQKS